MAESDLRSGLERFLGRYDVAPGKAEPLAVLLEFLAAPEAPTSVHDPRAALQVHIADSLAGLEVPELRQADAIADLGAGAGLPGLVLAAVLAPARVFLIESASRKCEFLRRAADAMGVENVEVIWTRAEEWRAGSGSCDVVCARAVAALPVLCEYAAPLLRDQGVLVAWKGAVDDLEAADASAAAAHLGMAIEPVHAVTPYDGSVQRTLQVVRKVAPTPPEFPRRPGIATKRPLTAKSLR
jgi:16S rRNA (guanine527-N7)-methyltransferase